MPRRTRRALVLAGALLVPLSLASALPRIQGDLLDRAVAAWAKVRTARATFEQTITNPLTDRTLTSSGTFQQQRPGKLSVTFADPANDRVVADGTHLWLYLPSTTPGQVIRTSLREGGSGTVDLSAQFLTAPRSRYTVTPAGTATVSGRATHAFTLVPKSERGAQFKTATVWIDDADATIRQFEVTEASGLQRRVRMTSFRTNVPVDASAFSFDVPAGVRVVDR
ncbi:MAG TPA: outer membrane lipoprotein carrier protein LolA [Gemmatimonadaceae bacterium]|jgi:outer membrane lipoprotein carrier protein|nr:outer membrane lipoprotein carrier protein LolA [Gemmatimonadaceae bacterium]